LDREGFLKPCFVYAPQYLGAQFQFLETVHFLSCFHGKVVFRESEASPSFKVAGYPESASAEFAVNTVSVLVVFKDWDGMRPVFSDFSGARRERTSPGSEALKSNLASSA
jgi:hypothetical protein